MELESAFAALKNDCGCVKRLAMHVVIIESDTSRSQGCCLWSLTGVDALSAISQRQPNASNFLNGMTEVMALIQILLFSCKCR
jgi:hypothetical protein